MRHGLYSIILVAAGVAARIISRTNPGRRSAAKLLTRDEAHGGELRQAAGAGARAGRFEF